MAGRQRLLTGLLGLVAIGGAVVYARVQAARLAALPVPRPPGEVTSPARTDAAAPLEPASHAPSSYALRAPSGRPASLSCPDARRILQQIHAALAYTPHPIAPAAFALATSDWLDPHGLWSASPDSPVPASLSREAGRLLAELDGGGSPACDASRAVGATLMQWTGELTARFDAGRRSATAGPSSSAAALRAAADAAFDEDGRPARELATVLGQRAGRLERHVGAGMSPYVEAARSRYFPPLDADGWAAVVRAAELRAYVQLADPHGAWAPTDEEASVFDLDLDPEPPDRLWEDAVRTALGVRIDSGPMNPLEVGDVVLSVAGVTTAGLPLEQLDQLVFATTDTPSEAPLVVLRAGEIRGLELPAPADTAGNEASTPPLPAYRVRYGRGDALVVEIHDVRSDLGEALAATLERETAAGPTRPLGLLLDLRDDGGGSTEGAIAALGLFLPGAPLFPMAHKDGSIEVDRAPEPPIGQRWTGPVATLVDGDTASAAEMIAGALFAYHRGAIVGERTYGKGCAQEYLDDEAGAGVLRLTTLLYALPDGSPVQGVGLQPSLLLPWPSREAAGQAPHPREADEPNAPPTWRGPDVRDPTLVLPPNGMAWPDADGLVGPCADPRVCQALRAIGAAPAKRPTAELLPPAAGGGPR